jgi:molybdenum cofactor synthesis domain-containing protein
MFRKLASVEEAKQALAKNFTPTPVGKERVSLPQALRRVLATDVKSPLDIPPFNRSTVDGYAVKSTDTFGADENTPVKLKLIGRIDVGETPRLTVKEGAAALIVTGAPIPNGADSVVMFEYTSQKGDTVLIHSSVTKDENIMKAGSDIHRSETILKKGTVLSSHEIGILAAVGMEKVDVFKQPKVAIFSTGAEVIEPGKPLPAGKIYDINAHTLSAAVEESGGQPINMSIAQDEIEQMKQALTKALETADLAMTSGGVSAGPTDILPKVLDTLGKPGVIVYGIAIRPGKPVTIAVINGKPVFSLPGHPASALLIFHLFVHPVIAKMTGRPEEPPITIKAVTAEKLFPARGRRTFVTVTLKRDKSGKIKAYPVPTGQYGAITTLAKADGFIEIHESQQFVDAGETVTVVLFKPDRYYSLMKE